MVDLEARPRTRVPFSLSCGCHGVGMVLGLPEMTR